jgi:hypothetical protein
MGLLSEQNVFFGNESMGIIMRENIFFCPLKLH